MASGNIFQQIYRSDDPKGRIRREIYKNRDRIRSLFGLTSQGDSQRFRNLEWQGLTLLLDQTSLVDQRILRSGQWEKKQLEYLLAAIDGQKDKSECLFLDIGAYWGLYALKAHQHGISNVHLFEPDPQNRCQLYAQLFLNGLHDAFVVHTFAASDRIGQVSFRKSDMIAANRGAACITQTQAADDFTVECRTIDSVITCSGQTIFGKIDVERNEIPALNGMRNVIANNRVFLQVEVFDENIEQTRACASDLGLRFVNRIKCDDYYSNFDPLTQAMPSPQP